MVQERALPLRLVLAALLISAAAGPASAADEEQIVVPDETFRTYCGSCHGAEAKGDGPIAEHLMVPPADLTKIAERHDGEFPAERIAAIIDGREKVSGHGSSEMPVWGDAFQKTEEGLSGEQVQRRIDLLVEYLESIQEE